MLHITWCRKYLVLLVNAHSINGGFLIQLVSEARCIINGAHVRPTFSSLPQSQGGTRATKLGAEDAGTNHWRYAREADGLLVLVEISDSFLNFLIDRHLITFEGIVRQVLGHSETAREKESIEIFCIELIDLLNITSCNSCRFYENIPFFRHLSAISMINDMSLIDIGSEDLYLSSIL